MRMWHNFTKLFTGFVFLRLRGFDVRCFSFYLPSIFALLVFVGVLLILGRHPSFSVELFDKIATIVTILLGFYMTSLAAVASFGQPLLDEKMKGDPPKLVVRYGNQTELISLSRRRFLSALFGYTIFISIVLVVLSLAFGLFDNSIVDLAQDDEGIVSWNLWLNIVFIPYIWLCCSLSVTTLLGVYYLVDRMHYD